MNKLEKLRSVFEANLNRSSSVKVESEAKAIDVNSIATELCLHATGFKFSRTVNGVHAILHDPPMGQVMISYVEGERYALVKVLKLYKNGETDKYIDAEFARLARKFDRAWDIAMEPGFRMEKVFPPKEKMTMRGSDSLQVNKEIDVFVRTK